ncbi:CBS domain-containing protein [Methanoregula sp.]|uniref:CBS domain-containing protein n=1 Tax=Methanoregula sp. TaxID=2052170 RepID=UPI002B627804|nr:CBS domain-containing protein [Methanoregula sp.]HVP96651.1 CBS domain-containing protein [Methanoregula sp.]
MPASSLAAADLMSSPVFVVAPGDTVAHARNMMVRHKISRVLVMDAGNLTGILTKKDIGYRLQQPGPAWRRRTPDRIPVAEYATPDPVTVAPPTLAKTVAGLFLARNISGVPVVDHGTVVGIITKSDLMKSALVAGLKGMVRDAMEDAETVNRWHSLAHVVALMKERNEKLVVTNNDGSVAGLITETNLAFHEESRRRPGRNPDEEAVRKHEQSGTGSRSDAAGTAPVTAGDVMSGPAITVAPVSTLLYAVELMQREQVNNLVVVENNTLVGILKRDDIIKEVAK